jgi:hypothetical protein
VLLVVLALRLFSPAPAPAPRTLPGRPLTLASLVKALPQTPLESPIEQELQGLVASAKSAAGYIEGALKFKHG